MPFFDDLNHTQDPDVVFMSISLAKASSILLAQPEVVQTVEEMEDALSSTSAANMLLP